MPNKKTLISISRCTESFPQNSSNVFHLLECSSLGGESIQTLGGALSDGSSKGHDSEVELDSCRLLLIYRLSRKSVRNIMS